ncbi:MAG: tRNA uridine-5-carboxymethylaminomethyl(34) synthesis GTPase MnmE [Kiritimatiellae bacterium]|nr:tRNA uridine-5-carboxymethylaminomethyl(34) synthesis GTPase MnmE [Kiritimatiellia bacterium]
MATAPGRGGVAVVRVSGPAAFRIASEVTGCKVDTSMAGRFFHSAFHPVGPRVPVRQQPIDDGLVLVFASPRSYTGEDVVELQGHGGSIAPRRVLEACLAAGARLARRGEFTQRAFLNGRLDLGMAEAVIDLVDARTERGADDAAARLMGAASRPLEEMYVAAIDLSSRVEHALDFSEDELPEGFSESVSRDVARLASLVERKLSTAREGRILREGALVVLCGRPNAGKSSLMNALLGEGRAIVSDEAGTTRDTIEEGAEIGGWPVRLVDTAGLREAEGEVEREGVRRAEALVAQADVVLHVIEPGDEAPAPLGIPPSAIRVFSKCDTTPPPNRPTTQLLTSAKTGEGIDALKDAIAARLGQIAAKSAEETGADVTTRQKEALLAARTALASANGALDAGEWTIAANELRSASEALGRLLGKVYSDDLLDALFSRFCVGK